MKRRFTFASLVLCAALAGCGGGEIPASNQPGGTISPEDEKKAMQESLDKMPAEQRARFEQQMKNMPVRPPMSGAGGGTPGAPAGGAPPINP